ncbi:MAG TPA: hypothetical protein VLQ93_21265, partial [Myxococcaceae bacterium]|nr:hypothetical protein [Myxococcaceae bacterium]
MKLTVRKLGLIERAELDIRPLTVLIGPNGTNKTWVAYALYGLLRNLTETVPSLPGIKASLSGGGGEELDARLRGISRELTEAVAKRKPARFSIPLLTHPDVSRQAAVAAVLEGNSLFLREILRLRG